MTTAFPWGEAYRVAFVAASTTWRIAISLLSRAIADVGLHEFRRQIEYKAKLNGARIIVADRWYPSSKTCSACGY